jgi:methylated-DNA-[protein]-cysteine S-methyltransferase
MTTRIKEFKTVIGDLSVSERDGRLVSLSFISPNAARLRSDADSRLLDEARKQIERYLSGNRTEFDLPLELDGSDFQRHVWDYLLTIPWGQTRTYGEVAEAIGAPGAARAVGTACGKNPVLIVVPCHRVVGSDGRLGGYVGGKAVKEWLLALEGATAARRRDSA